jgi:acyl-CoA synthetase (AMP-forming)/AMP-acid ligase II
VEQPFNIAFAFQEAARQMPDREALIAEDITLTYQKLARIIDRFSAQMQALGIGQSSTVAIDTTDMIVSVASIFALSCLGAQYTVPDRSFQDLDQQGVTHFLRSPERPGHPDRADVIMDESWSPKFDTAVSPIIRTPGFAHPDAPCWILGSSGTTGRPKFVTISEETVWKRVAVVKADYAVGTTRLFLLFGCNTRPFAIRAVAALLSGNAIVDSHSVPFLQQHGVNMVCGSPAQLAEWLRGRTISPKIACLQVSGAKLDDLASRSLLDSFEVVEDVYGSSETIVAHMNRLSLNEGRIERTGRTVQSDVEIIDETGAPLPEGQTGTVRIRNAHMATGYNGLPEETALRFRDGWFYPGDVGAWEPDGVLRILGRKDDVVNLGGRKFNLADIDASLQSDAGVRAACCFSDPTGGLQGGLAACLVLRPNAPVAETVKSAWAACARAFGETVAPASILVLDDMALTQDGMPRRRLTQSRFADTIAQGDRDHLRKALFRFQATDQGR